VAEAEARAERAAVINRVVQHARAGHDTDTMMANTLHELATSMNVSSALVQLGKSAEDLHIGYEWTAVDETPIGIASQIEIPVSHLAVRDGRTVAISDVRSDTRLRGDDLGQPEEYLRTGAISALVTPISLGGQLVGVLLVQMNDAPRSWTGDDVRLIEG